MQINEQELKEIQDQLVEKQAELSYRLDRLKVTAKKRLSADSKEQAIQLEDQEVRNGLMQEAVVELSKVNSALNRLEQGGFGRCHDCDENIPVARLKVYPYADYCIECETVREARAERP